MYVHTARGGCRPPGLQGPRARAGNVKVSHQPLLVSMLGGLGIGASLLHACKTYCTVDRVEYSLGCCVVGIILYLLLYSSLATDAFLGALATLRVLNFYAHLKKNSAPEGLPRRQEKRL